jgi:5-methylcytosine-specific restriction protein B
VTVTDYAGFDVPLLQAMVDGSTEKQAIFKAVRSALDDTLLPGDLRTMPRGQTVWEYRASWALTNLKKSGQARNPARGVWEITESGRKRLNVEKSWQLTSYQQSKSKVRLEVLPSSLPASEMLQPWSTDRWDRLGKQINRGVFEALDARLRPDLGPTPDIDTPLVRNVILYGPPGTGKTYLSKQVARALTGEEEIGEQERSAIVQFHPSYSYEDFIQGLKPDIEQTELRYTLSKGPFLKVCDAAEQDPDAFYVLVIDEINRGDPARIFGELLLGLEYRSQPIEMMLGGKLTVPPNLVIVGTMNSVDRSVALVDYALRRRFGFIRTDPDPEVIQGAAPLAQTLVEFNEWLASVLDVDHTLGHSFFMNPALAGSCEAALETIWKLDVRPLLEEYFFGEQERLVEASKKWRTVVKNALAEEDDSDSG